MKRIAVTLAASLLVCCLLSSGPARAATVKEYSADVVDVATGQVLQKIYIAAGKMRFDLFDAGEALASIAIMRLDQGRMYALRPDKTYMAIPMDPHLKTPQDMAGVIGIKPAIRRERQGVETVGGYATEKFRVTTSFDLGGQKNVLTHDEWLATEFDLPMRVRNLQDNRTTEMRNIRIGAPAAAMFEIPAGYTRNARMEARVQQMKQETPNEGR